MPQQRLEPIDPSKEDVQDALGPVASGAELGQFGLDVHVNGAEEVASSSSVWTTASAGSGRLADQAAELRPLPSPAVMPGSHRQPS